MVDLVWNLTPAGDNIPFAIRDINVKVIWKVKRNNVLKDVIKLLNHLVENVRLILASFKRFRWIVSNVVQLKRRLPLAV